jgi:hypothetical protein
MSKVHSHSPHHHTHHARDYALCSRVHLPAWCIKRSRSPIRRCTTLFTVAISSVVQLILARMRVVACDVRRRVGLSTIHTECRMCVTCFRSDVRLSVRLLGRLLRNAVEMYNDAHDVFNDRATPPHDHRALYTRVSGSAMLETAWRCRGDPRIAIGTMWTSF